MSFFKTDKTRKTQLYNIQSAIFLKYRETPDFQKIRNIEKSIALMEQVHETEDRRHSFTSFFLTDNRLLRYYHYQESYFKHMSDLKRTTPTFVEIFRDLRNEWSGSDNQYNTRFSNARSFLSSRTLTHSGNIWMLDDSHPLKDDDPDKVSPDSTNIFMYNSEDMSMSTISASHANEILTQNILGHSFDRAIQTALSKDEIRFVIDAQKAGYLTKSGMDYVLFTSKNLSDVQYQMANNINLQFNRDRKTKELAKNDILNIDFSNSKSIPDFEKIMQSVPSLHPIVESIKNANSSFKEEFFKIVDKKTQVYIDQHSADMYNRLRNEKLENITFQHNAKRMAEVFSDVQKNQIKEWTANPFEDRLKNNLSSYQDALNNKNVTTAKHLIGIKDQQEANKQTIFRNYENLKETYSSMQPSNFLEKPRAYSRYKDIKTISHLLYKKNDLRSDHHGVEQRYSGDKIRYSTVMRGYNALSDRFKELNKKANYTGFYATNILENSFSNKILSAKYHGTKLSSNVTHVLKTKFSKPIVGHQIIVHNTKKVLHDLSQAKQVQDVKLYADRMVSVGKATSRVAEKAIKHVKYVNYVRKKLINDQRILTQNMTVRTPLEKWKEKRSISYLNKLADGKKKYTLFTKVKLHNMKRAEQGLKPVGYSAYAGFRYALSWGSYYCTNTIRKNADVYLSDTINAFRSVYLAKDFARIGKRQVQRTLNIGRYAFLILKNRSNIDNINGRLKRSRYLLASVLNRRKGIQPRGAKPSYLQIGLKVANTFSTVNDYGQDLGKAGSKTIKTAVGTKRVAKGTVRGASKAYRNAKTLAKRTWQVVCHPIESAKHIGSFIRSMVQKTIALGSLIVANIVPILIGILILVIIINMTSIYGFFTDLFMVREEYDPATIFYDRITKLDYDKNKKMNKELAKQVSKAREKYQKIRNCDPVTAARVRAGMYSIETPMVEKMIIDEPFRLTDDPMLIRTDAVRVLYYLETLYDTQNLEAMTTYNENMGKIKTKAPLTLYNNEELGFAYLDDEEVQNANQYAIHTFRSQEGTLKGNYEYYLGDTLMKSTKRTAVIYRDPSTALIHMHDEMHNKAYSERVLLRKIPAFFGDKQIGTVPLYGKKYGSEPFDNWYNPTYVNTVEQFKKNNTLTNKSDTGLDKMALLNGGEDRIQSMDDSMNNFVFEYENPLGYDEETGEGISWIRRNRKKYYSETEGKIVENKNNPYEFPTSYVRRRFGFEGDQDKNIFQKVWEKFTKKQEDVDKDRDINTVVDISVSNGKVVNPKKQSKDSVGNEITDTISGEEKNEQGDAVGTVQGTKIYAPMGGKVEVASNSFAEATDTFKESNRVGGEYIVIKDVLKEHVIESMGTNEISGKDDDKKEPPDDEMMMIIIGGLDKASMKNIKKKIEDTNNNYMVDAGDYLGTVKLTKRDPPKSRFPNSGMTGNWKGLNMLASSSDDPGSPVYKTNLSGAEWENLFRKHFPKSSLLPENSARYGLPNGVTNGFFDTLAEVEQKTGINAMFLLAIVQQENSGCFGRIASNAGAARTKNNIYSVDAVDWNPTGNARSYATYSGSLIDVASLLSRLYLDPKGTYYHGLSVRGVATSYCSGPDGWASGVSYAMGRIFNAIQSEGLEGKHHDGYQPSNSSTSPGAIDVSSNYNPSQVTPHNSSSADPNNNFEPKEMMMETTAYTSDPAENGGYSVTATGKPIKKGVVAVDPKVIPLGTTLYIEGYGYATAEDTGGAIKGNRLDLAMDSKAEASAWGRRTVSVKVYPVGYVAPSGGSATGTGQNNKKEEVKRTPENIKDIRNYESILYMNMVYQYYPDPDEAFFMKWVHGKIRLAYINPVLKMASGSQDQENAQSYMLETGWGQLQDQFEEYQDAQGKADQVGFFGGRGAGKIMPAKGWQPAMAQYINDPAVIPGSVRQATLMWAATHEGIPYVLGGGHGQAFGTSSTLDCSSFVCTGWWAGGGMINQVYNTKSMPNSYVISIPKSQIKPGDAILRQGHHIEFYLGSGNERYITTGAHQESVPSGMSQWYQGITHFVTVRNIDEPAPAGIIDQLLADIHKYDPSFQLNGYGGNTTDPQ